jgi:hypothetical protein
MSNKLTIKSSTGVSIPTTFQLPLPIGDGQVYGDIVTFGTSGVTPGGVHIWDSTGEWAQANAGDETTAKYLLAIAISDNPSMGMLLRGFARFDTIFTSFTEGDVLYLSTTGGQITNTAPSSGGEVVRIVGYYVDDYTIYFNPDPTYIVL